MTKEEFMKEYLGEFVPTEKDRYLYELAEEYDRVCEAFDQRVCSGRRNGVAIPMTGEEMGAISRHARKVLIDLLTRDKSRDLKVTGREFQEALQNFHRNHR